MYLQPILQCKNHDCPSVAPIRLPYANPPKADEQPPSWPPDGWQLTLICRDCDHSYTYEKKDVGWANALNPADVAMWCVELQCNEPDCGSRTKWHLLDDGGMSENEIFEFIMRSDPLPLCGNGHSLVVSGATVRSAQTLSSL